MKSLGCVVRRIEIIEGTPLQDAQAYVSFCSSYYGRMINSSMISSIQIVTDPERRALAGIIDYSPFSIPHA